MGDREPDVIVVGAGPGGLATSHALSTAGVAHLVLERGPDVGHTWANLYDGLVLHTGKHLSALPGLPFPRSTPLFPTRDQFVSYLREYARRFQVPLAANTEAARIRPERGGWRVDTTAGATLRSRAIVVATGIVSNPRAPEFPGTRGFPGRVVHSVEYRRPDPFHGQRVLVVGAGNSAGEISVELANAGVDVAIAVRSGARVVPLRIGGVPIQYVSVALSWLPVRVQRRLARATSSLSKRLRGRTPLPDKEGGACANIPLIGFHLVDALRAGRIRLRPGVRELTPTGVRFSDGAEEPFDVVMLATGYRAALQPLRGHVQVDACGFALRRGRVASAQHANLFFVGHNYDMRGGLRNIAQDARLIARSLV